MSEESSSRWTCEACGCNTNTEEDDTISCGVCGTRREPALLRNRAYRLLQEGLVHRHLSAAAGGGGAYDEDDNEGIAFSAEDGDNDDEDDGMNYEIANDERRRVDRAAGSSHGAGGQDAISSAQLQRAERGARSAAAISSLLYGDGEEVQVSEGAGQRNRSDGRVTDHSTILATATENASTYQPQWTNPTASNNRRQGEGIIVNTEIHPNVAYLPEGGDEGRAVRAFPPLPRTRIGSSQSRGRGHRARSSSSAGRGPAAEGGNGRQVGFKVAFDHPNRSDGRGMGGCYLVGVTTAAAASPASSSPLSERHGLEESGVFWGVEDGGRRYEGRTSAEALSPSTLSGQMRNGPSSGSAASQLRRGGRFGRGRVPSLGPSSGVQMSVNEAPRNSDNVLYGSREVVTVVADLDSRTLTYWRDGLLLGTLVRNLPRTGSLHPVAVPFNSGVSVAITGLDGDPLTALSDARATQRRSQLERDEMRRLALSDQRAKLICDGQLSQEMMVILRTIFSWYGASGTEGATNDPNAARLGTLPAARLWYRCGLRLSYLQGLLDLSLGVCNESVEPYITADDFVDVVARLVKEEDDSLKAAQNDATEGSSSALTSPSMITSSRRHPVGSTSSSAHTFEVGDMVEVVDDYERIGDAASGPLRPGERGTVMEVQRGPRGSRPSIRVVYNGRRWWYQPQALMSERSGLVESPVARLLRSILRSHGYDHATLKPIWGQHVTAESWQVGDLVVPARFPCGRAHRKENSTVVGRIIADTSLSSPRGRDSTYVTVEFADPSFGEAVGAIGSGGISPGSSLVSVRRVRVHNLVHSTFYHGASVVGTTSATSVRTTASIESMEERQNIEPDSDDQCEDCYDDCSEADESECMNTEAPTGIIVNGALKANIEQISTLNTTAMSDITSECVRNRASLASMFEAGLPDAITSALDHAEDQVDKAVAKGRSTSGISASSLSALCGLAVVVCEQLFVDEDDNTKAESARKTTRTEASSEASPSLDATISARSPLSENSSSPPRRSDASFARPLLPPQHQRPAFAENQSQESASVRDLIRDLGAAGTTAEQRRSLLLALMSRARMNDEGQSAAVNIASAGSTSREMDYRSLISAVQQGRGQLLSFEGQNGAELHSFGLGMANLSYQSRQQLTSGQYAPPNHSELLDNLGGMLSSRARGGLGSGSNRATSSPGARQPPSSQPQRSDRTSDPDMDQRGSSVSGRERALTLFEKVLRKGGAGGEFSVRSPTTVRRGNVAVINTQARSLIYNGLLLNDLLWVQKSLGMSGNSKHAFSASPASVDLMSVRDEDEITPLLLAIFLGCRTQLVHTLIKAGSVVGDQEVKQAALSNQPQTLSLLLWHTTYTVGSVDVSSCSSEVVKVLDEASARQKSQEETMKCNAGRFVSTMVRKTVNLALKFRLLGRKLGSFFPESDAFARILSDALIGKVLLYAIHKSQSDGLSENAKEESNDQRAVSSGTAGSAMAEDGRMPAFSSNRDKDHSGHPERNACMGGKLQSDLCMPLALLRIVPTSCLVDALTGKVCDETGAPDSRKSTQRANQAAQSPCLRSYLRLAESYLWSKKVGDAATGLSFMRILLKEAQLLSETEIGRYGIKNLAESLYKLAEDSISEICASHSWAAAESNSPAMAGEKISRAGPAGVVLCPKLHTTVLHLTRHSSFRCDICGKGVDQGQPMHGCRECDWDACEICTDEAEGGFVKWRHVRDLAFEVRHLLTREDCRMTSVLDDDGRADNKSACDLNEELWTLSQNIRHRNCASVQQLQKMLQTPGRVTIHEFSSDILPSLHDALVSDCDYGNEMEQGHDGLATHTPSRRSKKPRVSDVGEADCRKTSSTIAVAAGEADFGTQNDFNRAVVKNLILSTDSLAAREETATVMCTGEDDDASNDDNEEEDDDDDESDDLQRDSKSPRQTPKSVPELLQFLHSTMAFYERAPVRKHKLKKPTTASSGAGTAGAGELQSLTLPIEIELLPLPKGSESGQTHTREAQDFVNAPQQANIPANGVTVHVEPLMPMIELQLHVLRTCRIFEPAYLHFCRRLAYDRAIIAEKPKASPSSSVIRRIAHIVAFDEATGAHVVRYASRFVVDNAGSMEDSMLHSDIFDQLEFQGREVLLVLASRDYFVLRRDESSINDNNVILCGANQELRDVDEILRNTDAYAMQNDMNLSSLPSPYVYQHGRRTSENESGRPTLLTKGTRIESNVDSPDGSWFPGTIISAELEDNCVGVANLYFGNTQSIPNLGALSAQDRPKYNLVTDSGEVKVGVFSKNIRGHNTLLQQQHIRMQRESRALQEGGTDPLLGGSHVMYGQAPAATVRRGLSARNNDASLSESAAGRPAHSSTPSVGVLKRTWSALSPIEKMCSLDLFVPAEDGASVPATAHEYPEETTPTTEKCGGDEFEIDVDIADVEKMPSLSIGFSLHESRPTAQVPHTEEDTVFGGLCRLAAKDDDILQKTSMNRKCRLYFSVNIEAAAQKGGGVPSTYSSPYAREDPESDDTALYEIAKSFGTHQLPSAWEEMTVCGEQTSTGARKRKVESLCEGLSRACVQCMQILSCLAENLTDYHRDIMMLSKTRNTEVGKVPDLEDLLPMFESDELTRKLLDQLEDPLAVVGGALPDWCMAAPSFSPRIFSHSARRLLLERAAFGVSRSALRQQESKVAVGPLRQRMAALRGRAVELVGEAFSGGAADPTALQLQADELYGMEEALAARVKAAFRTQSWEECSLQCCKAAVRRDALLTDAAVVMKKYCSNADARRRRLEVRFEGESGFDAASGNQAGVTRGFYADVAEALLSSDHVSSVHCLPICPSGSSEVARMNGSSLRARKLPLWIPDLDSSQKVIIPTPSADAHSQLGVFPRPLSSHHPQYEEVLVQFRFMGRLFAAALRDGFVFPLPLSTSFLRMVQAGSFDCSFSPRDEFGNTHSRSSLTGTKPELTNDSSFHQSVSIGAELVLTSRDLPRPGFLGGEVYAVESHICSALDKLDCSEPALSHKELRKCRDEIASDKSFARRALGKSYDCSFEDYFEGRTFVDPLDPTQGEDAFPLCLNGHQRSVNIDNVREWVTLAKQFIFGGVQAQALAFRRGISDFFSADALRLFTAEELQRDVCGGGDKIDNWDERAIRSLFKLDGGKGAAEALVAVAAMGGEGGAALSRRFGPSSPTIGYLVKALLEATPTQRRQFLSFVTSVPIVTPGAIEVVPVVNPSGDFLPMHDPSCLPRANTCARRLYLPKFESYGCFVKVLWAVVQEECRFKGFFEWRG